MTHGPRGEYVPGVLSQSDGRGKGGIIMDAPHRLGSHAGGATWPPGAGGAAAAAAGTGSPYQVGAYPEGVTAAFVVGASGAYGWCCY